MTWRWAGMLTIVIALTTPATGAAQSLGIFRWQLQPFCNVVTMAVTQNGGVYRLEGTDDQCGGAGQASAMGTAFPNPDGSIGFGFTIVTAPGGASVHVDATIGIATLSGTWRDSAGSHGSFVFTPGAGTGGSTRPAPVSAVPGTIQLRPDGGVLAEGTHSVGTVPASGTGVRMMWYPAKAAFRAGQVDARSAAAWDEANVGEHSAALGLNTVASGEVSTALGSFTRAGGLMSTAMGRETTASGQHSTAMGFSTEATGSNSTAMGEETTASGRAATALGSATTASGSDSLAAGRRVSAGGASSVALGRAVSASTNGTFMFGDMSAADFNPMLSSVANQFLVRAAGGVGFYSNSTLSAGVTLAAGASAWSSVSDVNLKTRFRELSGDDVLAKLARMPIHEWSYKAQDAAIRHVGPTAQEFHAAFGLGEDPRRISTIDADGVALRAIQALELREREANATQESEIGALQQAIRNQAVEIDALRAMVAELSRKLVDARSAPQEPKPKP